MLYTLFVLAIILLVMLIGTAVYFVILKRDQGVEEKNRSKIHQSGQFSLIRKSPKNEQMNRQITMDQVLRTLKEGEVKPFETKDVNESLAKKYLDLWESRLENSINTIDEGDRAGLETYSYSVPADEVAACKSFCENVYVTREQLQNYPQLMPPFHLGCKVSLIPKQAWNTNLDGTGWKAVLPKDGKYITPDWSIIGPA